MKQESVNVWPVIKILAGKGPKPTKPGLVGLEFYGPVDTIKSTLVRISRQ